VLVVEASQKDGVFGGGGVVGVVDDGLAEDAPSPINAIDGDYERLRTQPQMGRAGRVTVNISVKRSKNNPGTLCDGGDRRP